MKSRLTRRDLFKAGAVAGAAAGLSLMRGPTILAAGPAPSGKVRVAVIGCGGRGASAHLPPAAREHLVAIVDADEKNWAKGMKFLADKAPDANASGVKTYCDYRKMFDECAKDIDAVTIATTNHHHFLPAMIAMSLGKAAYVEKPMAHSIEQARQMAAASLKYKVATQMGNQGHCGEGYRRLCEYIWAGAIGNVTEVHCWTNRDNGGSTPRPPAEPVPAGMHWDEWIGPSPYRDFHKDLHPHEWHGWYDFGNGSLGNMACHVMDGPVWALKLRHPTSIEAEYILGGTNERYPVGDRLRYDFPARGNMPPVKLYWWDGRKPGAGTKSAPAGEKSEDADGVAAGSQNWPTVADEWKKKTGLKLDGSGTIYIGDKGVMFTGTYGGGVTLLPVEKMKEFPVPAPSIPRIKGGPFEEFFGAIRNGNTQTCSNFVVSSVLTEVTCIGNLAQKAGLGKKVLWDGPNMKCTNLPEINKLVQLQYRKGWAPPTV